MARASLYLGLDCSTQSLTAIVIEVDGDRRRVVFEQSLEFDREFPAYGTVNGVRRDERDPRVVVSFPLMWAEALDRMMGMVAAEPWVSSIRAISGSAQQHGSVYLAAEAGPTLSSLDARTPLAEQLRGTFSRAEAPVWMDASTSADCAAIEDAVGGGDALASLTGSRAFERFTGPQIRKFAREHPEGYARTDRIHLVSSYLASLLSGGHAPLEPGDAAGMNLMDIGTRRFAPAALAATAPDLERRLPDIRPSTSIVGPLAPYWTQRYGFPAAKVVAWTGDNPSSLIGTGLIDDGRIAISLGTSDTLFGFMREARVDPSGAAHVFGAPTGNYMSLVCFKNGSLARDRIRQEIGLDWDGFASALRATRPGNGGAVLLPWFEPEITPSVVHPGVRRYGLESSDGPANVRGVVEWQMLAMKRHSRWTGARVQVIHATGGAAINREILRVMAGVFDADVYQLPARNSACLGAALRAWHADRHAGPARITWDEVVAGFADPVPESRIRPAAQEVEIYADLERLHAACEAHALHGGAHPAPLLAAFRSARS